MTHTTNVNLGCTVAGCRDRIGLEIVTQRADYGLAGGHHNFALEQAAEYLGWDVKNRRCPRHKDPATL